MGKLVKFIKHLFKKVLLIFRSITVEPVTGLFIFALTLSINASRIMYIYKVCEFKFPSSKNICSVIQNGNHSDMLDQVQKEVADIQTYGLALEIIPSTLAAFILTNAADKIGRKKLLIIPIIGYILFNITYIINWFFSASPYWMLFEAISGLFGGRSVLQVATYTYICDITSEDNRSIRLSILGFLELGASGLGVFTTGFILELVHYNFYFVYGTSLVILFLVLFYIIFCLEETKTLEEKNFHLSMIFTFSNVREGIDCVFKKRENGSRLIILSLVMAYWLCSVQYLGVYHGPILLYFYQLGWQYVEYTNYMLYITSVLFISFLTIIPFMLQFIKLSDMMVALIGEVCLLANNLLLICSSFRDFTLPYVALALNSGGVGAVGICITSALSKQVPKDQVARIMAFLGMALPLSGIGAPIFNSLFRWSLNWDWCRNVESVGKDWCITSFLLLGLVFLVVNIVIYAFVFILIRNQRENVKKSIADAEKMSPQTKL